MNILFLCTANINRSKSAEVLCGRLDDNNTYRSAGLSAKYTAANNSVLCTEKLLSWADHVYVFEQMHLDRIKQYTQEKYLGKILNLDIEDRYKYMNPELVQLLKLKIHEYPNN